MIFVNRESKDFKTGVIFNKARPFRRPITVNKVADKKRYTKIDSLNKVDNLERKY